MRLKGTMFYRINFYLELRLDIAQKKLFWIVQNIENISIFYTGTKIKTTKAKI